MNRILKYSILFLSFCYSINLSAQEVISSDEIISDRQDAQYPGGFSALENYIKNNVYYPEEALKHKTKGNVYVQFYIEKDGSVNEVRIVRNLSTYCDIEAVKVVSSLPKWIPAKKGDSTVRETITVKVSFSPEMFKEKNEYKKEKLSLLKRKLIESQINLNKAKEELNLAEEKAKKAEKIFNEAKVNYEKELILQNE